jgi:hypothetical protein
VDHDSEVLQRLVRLETKLDMMLNDPTKDKRINDLEDNQRWLWRAVFGTFITGAVTYIIKVM